MRRDTRGQSETIGATLLVGVVVVAVTTTGAFIILDGSSTESVPLVDIDASADESDLTLVHESGPSLAVDEVVVIIEGDGNRKRAKMKVDEVTGSDGKFGFGDSFVRAHGVAGDELEVLVVHTPSNAVLTEQLVQIRSTTGSNEPQAAFTYGPTSPSSGEVVTFDARTSTDPDGNIVSYVWDFDNDGNIDATGAQVTHTYASAGTYTASVTVTDDDGRTAMAAKTVTVSTAGSAPSASFTYSPSNPSTDETVNFDASGSSDSDGTITSYEWDFNGDGTTNATGQTVSTSYTQDRSNDVTLTVTDDSGKTDSVTKTITVANDPPTADFSYSPSNPDTQDTVDFTATASDSDGSINSYAWDFGDGDTTSGSSVSHSYSNGDSYDVTLTVTDDDGATTTVTKTVQVDNVAPTAEFTYSPSPVHTAEDVEFDASGSSDPDGSITSYEWDFGDGATATGETPTHAYDSPGRYDVTVTVTDDDGATATRTKTVEVGGLRYADVSNTFEGSKQNTDSIATFFVQNNASTDLTVSGVTVSATGKADYFRSEEYEPDDNDGDADFYLFGSNRGYARRVVNGPSRESGYETGNQFELEYGFDGDSARTYTLIDSGDYARAYFIEFVDRKQAGPNTNFKPIDMSGETVTVTFEFEYADGTTDTETLDVQLPN